MIRYFGRPCQITLMCGECRISHGIVEDERQYSPMEGRTMSPCFAQLVTTQDPASFLAYCHILEDNPCLLTGQSKRNPANWKVVKILVEGEDVTDEYTPRGVLKQALERSQVPAFVKLAEDEGEFEMEEKCDCNGTCGGTVLGGCACHYKGGHL